jgi:hypothetical protein
MSRSFPHRQTRFRPAGRWVLAAILGAGCIFLPALASAQAKKKAANDHEKRTGKVFEVEKKGKTASLIVEEADGEKLKVDVTSKMKFMVRGTGDSGFLKHPKAVVSSDSVFAANRQFFGKKFTVHLGNSPAALFEQDENNAEVYHIAGPIVDCDETSFAINVAGEPYKVNFEQGAELSVAIESTDPDHASVGSPVEVEGTTRGGKFHATSVVVNLERPLVADEVFAAGDKKGPKSKTTAASKTAKKPAKSGDKGDKEDMPEKTDDTPATADPLKPGSNSDPFGVLKDNNKKDPKKKPAPVKPKPKKPTEDPDAGS